MLSIFHISGREMHQKIRWDVRGYTPHGHVRDDDRFEWQQRAPGAQWRRHSPVLESTTRTDASQSTTPRPLVQTVLDVEASDSERQLFGYCSQLRSAFLNLRAFSSHFAGHSVYFGNLLHNPARGIGCLGDALVR